MGQEDERDEEKRRIEELRRFHAWTTPADGTFDRVARLAAMTFDVPIAVVSLVDEDRIWFAGRDGLDQQEVARAPGLCTSVIMSDDVYVVENALDDPRTLTNPLVAGELGMRFYAGAPLITKEGYRLGAMAVLDVKPRTLSPERQATLEDFAGLVMDQMELRLSARQMAQGLERLLGGMKELTELTEYITMCAWTKKIRIGEDWLNFEEFLRERLGLAVTHGIHPDAVDEASRDD